MDFVVGPQKDFFAFSMTFIELGELWNSKKKENKKNINNELKDRQQFDKYDISIPVVDII